MDGKKTTLAVSVAALFLFGAGLTAGLPGSGGIAYAKPPDWAPAHGYRRKHKDKEKYDRRDDDDRDDWRSKVDDELERRFPHYREFRRLDDNEDGRISLREWSGDDDLFRKLDRNRDGYLSRSEYEHIDEERGPVDRFFAAVKNKVVSFVEWLF